MTSSRNRSRRRRSTFDRAIVRRLVVGIGCAAAFGVAVYAFFALSPLRQDPAQARASVQQSLALLEQGNVTAARDAALSAVRSDPGSAEAHLALARTQLLLGDGAGAEGELRRAADAGFDAAKLHHLVAHALLLEGKPDQALAEAEKTDAPNRAYALRIRARALTAQGDFAGADAAVAEAIRIAPRDADVWVDAGRFRVAAGDVAGAIEASTRAVALDRNDGDALVLRGQLVRTQFGLVAALPWFEAALQRDPADFDALIEYAATLGDAGRANDMLAATRRALAVRPGNPQALYLQAVLAARAGNYDLARSLVEKTGGAIDALPGMLLLGGTLDLDSGDVEQAIGKLRQLVDLQPMNFDARRLLAQAYLRGDSARNAIDVLAPLTDSYSLTLAARAYERSGDRVMADQLLDRAARATGGDGTPFATGDSVSVLSGPAAADPDNPNTVIPYIRALAASGDRQGAAARAQALAASNPGAPGAHLVLGDTLMLLGRWSDAANAYKAAASLRFDEPVMLRLVEAFDRAGRRAEAASALALFVQQNPWNAAAQRLSAQWQVAGGAYDAAVDTLEGLRSRIGDRDAAIGSLLALAYLGSGDGDSARSYAESAYALAPASAAAADAYGWTLYQAGDLDGAAELLRKAALLAPGNAGVAWHLAQATSELNRKPQAQVKPAGNPS
ncbi:tetratricopeptide repeat protein [Sphingomonas sp.]|uniref:tetratricopeptide repeat protein n=1 Tax=Sphingomonas sp. TaxID=28214 RepID=UPI001B1E699A|nr:tetratricopeptide repeat protein [Sphingomonas sp.]MBO9714054.1 tetratricopeptide repeat protein [Sphingomonas sp.]